MEILNYHQWILYIQVGAEGLCLHPDVAGLGRQFTTAGRRVRRLPLERTGHMMDADYRLNFHGCASAHAGAGIADLPSLLHTPEDAGMFLYEAQGTAGSASETQSLII